jgi:hypothetical protein
VDASRALSALPRERYQEWKPTQPSQPRISGGALLSALRATLPPLLAVCPVWKGGSRVMGRRAVSSF